MRSNLDHAFPERDRAWKDRVGRMTSARLVEMALFAMASPFFSREWYVTHLELPDEDRERMRESTTTGAVVLLPHVTLFEMMGAIPAILPEGEGHSAVYRPLKQPALDRWVKESREKWGIRMISRKDGFAGVVRPIRDGKCLTLLFDQNTGRQGCLIYFMKRPVSATHLPGLLARKFDRPAFLMIPRRTGFWRARLNFLPLPQPEEAVDLTLSGHQWLEQYLRGSEEQAADWLWYHNRWGTHDSPRRRFFLREKDNYLEKSRLFNGLEARPRTTRLWFRMPNWLGDVVMALPLIRAVRAGRPDAEIVLLAQPALRPLLERCEVADVILDLPDKSEGSVAYFGRFFELRHRYPDAYLCLTNSGRGDLESYLTRAPLRLGMLRPGKRRPLLTDGWRRPESMDERQCHQLDVWEAMFRYYGLREPLSREGFVSSKRKQANEQEGIGLICGTENMPEKRWPVDRWRGLVDRFLKETSETLYLYGTPRDRAITDRVAEGFDGQRVQNLAGQTNLEEFLNHLGERHAIVCNDTGGMHMANLLGVPVFAIFGPTNPVRTGPVFEAGRHIIQPPDCPATGGIAIEGVTVDHVWDTWTQWKG